MSSLKKSVTQTVQYSQYFNYCLSPKELHFWLISSQTVSFAKLKPFLPSTLASTQSLNFHSQQKIKNASWLIKFFPIIPTIRFVGITGSVAANNAKPGDDTDFFIITTSNSLWFTRLLLTIILIFTKHRRLPNNPNQDLSHAFCFNLWLEEGSLLISPDKQNLYSAREILQTNPIYDPDSLYQQLLLQNSWISHYHANAYSSLLSQKTLLATPKQNLIISMIITPLNLLLYYLQKIYMKPKITHETVTYHTAFFHPTNYFHKLQKGLKWLS